MKSWSVTIAIKIVSASLAQWLEHWSCKPGVESSNLSRGYSCFSFYASIGLGFSYPTKWQSTLAVKLFFTELASSKLILYPFFFVFSICNNLQLRTFDIMLCKLLRSFYSLDRRNPSFTSQMKATEQYFPIVLFIMLYKVFLTFKSMDEIWKCDHSNGSYSIVWSTVNFRWKIIKI